MKPIYSCLNVPTDLDDVMRAGAALAISISGGKDSQALLGAVLDEHQRRAWPGPVFAIHADLGRAEWSETPGHCQKIVNAAGLELVVVRRRKGDLVTRWQERMETLKGTGKPFWSSSASRYCTSDLKRDPINSYLRRYPLIVSAIGIRAQESDKRAVMPLFALNQRISGKAGRGRRAFVWNAIHDWQIADVWRACGTDQEDLERRRELYRCGRAIEALDGWPAHPAYVYGNERLSCALCVLATKNDLRNGARHQPELYQILTSMEEQSGCSFKKGFSLSTDLFNAHERALLLRDPKENDVHDGVTDEYQYGQCSGRTVGADCQFSLF